MSEFCSSLWCCFFQTSLFSTHSLTSMNRSGLHWTLNWGCIQRAELCKKIFPVKDLQIQPLVFPKAYTQFPQFSTILGYCATIRDFSSRQSWGWVLWKLLFVSLLVVLLHLLSHIQCGKPFSFLLLGYFKWLYKSVSCYYIYQSFYLIENLLYTHAPTHVHTHTNTHVYTLCFCNTIFLYSFSCSVSYSLNPHPPTTCPTTSGNNFL